MALHQSATALHQPMLAFAGIERDRCGLRPFPTWALIKRYGDTPSYAQLNHRQLYIRGEAIRLAGLAFKWPQGQTYTRHYRIPSTLFLLSLAAVPAPLSKRACVRARESKVSREIVSQLR